jgi:putative ABC transport system permease protein
MKTLFGIPMDSIMLVMLIVFLLVTAVVVVLALRNRLLLKLGLRNIPRRPAQTVLIIVGLMLSTVIITAAFGTGDTLSYSVRSTVVTSVGYVDEAVFHTLGIGPQTLVNGVGPFSPRVVQEIQANVAANKSAEASMPALIASAPLQDLTSRQTKAGSLIEAFPSTYPAKFGPLTTDGGSTVTLKQLGPNETYLNAKAADNLNAHPGDTVVAFLLGQPMQLRVRAILRDENLASGGLSSGGTQLLPSIIMPLERLGQAPNVVLISNKGDATSGADNTDAVTNPLRALLANPKNVAVAQALLASPVGQAQLTKLIGDPLQAGAKSKLTVLHTEVMQHGQSDRLKSLLSDPTIVNALKSIKAPAVARPLNDTLASISDYSVQTVKKDGLDYADILGSVFVSIFIVFGLFSIAAGVLLIFLIFVMLATERRAEMGMARAVGTKRRQLIQQFLFEGYAYNLGAALVGIALGVVVGLGLARIMTYLLRATDFTVIGHIEPRSLVVSFCLGALVTFLTVVFSSFRASRLNIVAAIRDLPEEFGVNKTVASAWQRSLQRLPLHPRRSPVRTIVSILGLLAALALGGVANGGISVAIVLLMLAIYFWPLILAMLARGPVLIVGGAVLTVVGIGTNQAAWFSIGNSLMLIGISMLIRWGLSFTDMREVIANRIGYTLAGLTLVIYWMLPFDFWQKIGLPNLSGGIEMFFVSGMLLVIGGVWAVMFNADLIAAGLMWAFSRAGSLALVMKMAVTYPMQYKFRTGLTLAMFSLVIFTLMVMSILIRSTSSGLQYGRDTGGYQIYGAVSEPDSMANNAATIAANPALHRAIEAVGGIGKVAIGIRQPGQTDQSWRQYIANVLDPAYLASTQYTLHSRATGFSSDAAVWETLRTQPGYAVIDSFLAVQPNGSGGPPSAFTVQGIKYEDKTFRPQLIEIRDSRSGMIISLKVIGVLDSYAAFLPDLTQGVYTSVSSFTAQGAPDVRPTTYVFRVAPGADVHATALLLGQTFLHEGLDVKEAQKEYNANLAFNNGINYLLEGFMALGLIVGIAALGVVAFRSVVERRQQIGVMRAIGFQQRMVRTAFLLESSFVAILGTLLGVVLGGVLSYNLVASIAKTNNSVTFAVPWLQILLIVVVAYIASLLTTYLPARQASRVYPAEALRYE